MVVKSSRPTDDAAPIKRVPLGRMMADALRRAILTGRYKPGERLVEDRLAGELGGSRVPIREAPETLGGGRPGEVAPERRAPVAEPSPELVHQPVQERAAR